jgi:hypothetical protein
MFSADQHRVESEPYMTVIINGLIQQKIRIHASAWRSGDRACERTAETSIRAGVWDAQTDALVKKAANISRTAAVHRARLPESNTTCSAVTLRQARNRRHHAEF